MHDLLVTILLGIVEGITEFLPVSSTGHMLLCEKWLGMDLDEPFWKMFTIFIQIGAILAVVVYFRERIIGLLRGLGGNPDRLTPLEAARPMARELPTSVAAPAGRAQAGVLAYAGSNVSIGRISPLWLTLLATVPVLVIGKLAHKWVENYMEAPQRVALTVGLALGIGGVLIALIEKYRPAVRTVRIEHMTLGQAMVIGFAQVLAVLFPGTSRSAATIMPGLMVGMSREAAAEFSFFLAIPAMFAACGYSLLKQRSHLTGQQWMLLTIGTLVSFLVAWVVIAGFMSFIRRRSFMPFAIYRIALAAVILVAAR